MFGIILAAVIELTGVTGEDLRSRAFFDANNVLVGDPLVLTIDFLGEADFSSLHPPVLAKSVNRRDWKIDDASAKTSTFQDARRLTYRIRPMREGVLYFPELEFSYLEKSGEKRTVRSNAIPVHAKPGSQVVVKEMGEADEKGFPKPPELIAEVKIADRDELFRWKKALSHPTADGFAKFDFPEAKMNEATCAIREGNWSRAMSIYRLLEWRIGQTEAIERGIIAAEALKYDNPSAVLPVWREVGRPLLRHDWKGRVGLVAGAIAALVILFWLIGRGIRALACLGLVALFAGAAFGETIETVTTNADGSIVHRKIIRGGNGSSSFSITTSSSSGGMTRMPSMGGIDRDPFSMFDDEDFPFGGMRRRRQQLPPVSISVGLMSDKREVTVGENFNLVLAIDRTRGISFSEGVNLSLAERNLITQTSPAYTLRQEQSVNPTNVIDRLVFPMRALAPIKGPLHYSVSGNYVRGGERGGFGFGLFQKAYPYSSGPKTCPFVVKEPPSAGRPEDYAGIVSEGLSIVELPDILQVETNDVITITYRMKFKGYVPPRFLPKDVAFEWNREERSGTIEYRRFFVADGAPATPALKVSYYDPQLKRYRTVKSGGTLIRYRKVEEGSAAK